MSVLMIVFVILLVARLAGQLWLAALNQREVRRHAGAVPAAFSEVMDEATYRKAVDYTLAKSRFGRVEDVFDSALLAVVILGGLLPWWYGQVLGWFGWAHWVDALYLFSVGALLSLPSLPLDWWGQFRLEERFGFNRSSLRLWITDKVKGFLLGFLIGFPLLWFLLSLVGWTGEGWWLWAFVAFFGFQLLMMVLYPKLILPLFNRLDPLPEGELKSRLMELADRTGFRASTIQVIDGSKRSGHSNAFFTGFGRFRRIVLFDTLIQQLAPEELEAVLAHEIGHYKKGHIPKMLLLSAASTLGAFALIAWLARSPWFYEAFGFSTGSVAPAFLLFGLLSGLVTFWLSPLFKVLSRKHEYEADAFARAAMGAPQPLIAALRKLTRENLSNLTPHPAFSRFYYSHPTLMERETALQG